MQILQRFSVTLSSMIIAIFVCNYLYVNILKLQQISLITKSIDTYNSSNSRYLSIFSVVHIISRLLVSFVQFQWSINLSMIFS